MRLAGLVVCGGALLLAIAGPLGVRLGVPPLAALGVFAGSAVLGLGGAVWGLFTAIRHTEDDRPRARVALAAAGLALIPVILMARGLWNSRGFTDGLDDAATDAARPVAFEHASALPVNAGRSFEYDRTLGAEIARRHPELRPLLLPESPADAYARALALARRMKTWEVATASAERRTFEAVATSRAFRFQDDVVVAVTSAPDGRARVDVRSKSREPRGDFGINARRVVQYLSLLQKGGTPILQ